MATKKQKEFAADFFEKHPNVEALFLNKQGEFFTDEDYCKNSLQKDKDGKIEAYETLKRETLNLKENSDV
ncbi:hypothetical protein [Riemerella anatipestifer]|uniref:Uncharacterized protein n=1 Tax=Riemerella anatipestifer TaxID=34085 RepID=A0A1S7DV43_RIEAN|nr:hypothetical protein [Riemerella anatipestifer]AQY22980.1 hypothetical protein AB406_2040 [Riemerella anatipestifer]MBT0556842.1 hypothetical protein [Riemerella anatipestifer]MCO7355765.1 hypothetical protein [Riemerella anatipestifer]MDY3351869.1 hypothetical protein [Riemerella anatipestifer]MDY3525052.1 hypothetical protein [Riemerella anatipestifer]